MAELLARAILVTPSYDKFTEGLNIAADYLGRYLSEKKIDYKRLLDVTAIRPTLMRTLEIWKPRYFIFYGHGDEGAIYGQNDALLVDTDRAKDLSGMSVYACAESSVIGLGDEAKKQRVSAYVGLNDIFGIYYERGELPRGFVEVLNAPAIALIDGKGERGAVDETHREVKRWIEYWNRSDVPEKSQYMAQLAWIGKHMAYPGMPRPIIP